MKREKYWFLSVTGISAFLPEGMEAFEECRCYIYDSLVGQVFGHLTEARLINVGNVDKHTMPQEGTNQPCSERSSEGKSCCPSGGGDPFLDAEGRRTGTSDRK